jgi:hypothetical protein
MEKMMSESETINAISFFNGGLFDVINPINPKTKDDIKYYCYRLYGKDDYELTGFIVRDNKVYEYIEDRHENVELRYTSLSEIQSDFKYEFLFPYND